MEKTVPDTPDCCAKSEARWWHDGAIDTPAGPVTRISTTLTRRDWLGHWRVRWGFGRMTYRVAPGLHAIGSPDSRSRVLVTANYKLSFDRLRVQLGGRDVWVLVLDTRGVNVWCAAGKGTFSTDELISRIESTRLAEIVAHRKLILPQLGATGVSAHQVEERSGWRVSFGPVRAVDLPAFLDAGARATPAMRRVRFPLRERAVLVPVDLVGWARFLIPVMIAMALLAGLRAGGYGLQGILSGGLTSAVMLLVAWLTGAALAPLLLPWLPGRAFATKGLWLGIPIALLCWWWGKDGPLTFENLPTVIGWLLLVPAIASFLMMNFTGASTYTSLSGVRREMRVAVPIQVTAATIGLTLWLVGRFV